MAAPTLEREPVWLDSTAKVREIFAAPFPDTYALDTEFMSGTTYRPVLALVQLAYQGTIYLIDALSVDVAALRPLFESNAFMILHAGQADLELLVPRVGCAPARLLDTQIAASLLGFSSISLAALVRSVLGVDLDKSARMTDWSKRPLLKSQRHYAAFDVAYLEQIGAEILSSLDRVNRRAWLEEECERLRTRQYPEPDPAQAWTRLKGANSLGPIQRSRAQAVAAWREIRARSEDRIPARVLSDEIVIDIARQAPGSRHDLAEMRRLKGQSDHALDGIWRALSNAPANAPEPLADLSVDKSYDQTLQLLLASVQQLAKDHTIDPTILATRSDLSNWLSRRPSRLDSGWRHELLALLLTDVLAGRVMLRVVNKGRSLEFVDQSGSRVVPTL